MNNQGNGEANSCQRYRCIIQHNQNTETLCARFKLRHGNQCGFLLMEKFISISTYVQLTHKFYMENNPVSTFPSASLLSEWFKLLKLGVRTYSISNYLKSLRISPSRCGMYVSNNPDPESTQMPYNYTTIPTLVCFSPKKHARNSGKLKNDLHFTIVTHIYWSHINVIPLSHCRRYHQW